MKLTSKQEAFAQAIASGMNQSDAYRSAYNASKMNKTCHEQASRVMANSKVSARVAELKALVAERVTEKTSIDKAWVLAELVEVVEMGKAAEPVRDAEGNPVGEYKTNLAATNKALELIGKELLMFIDRKDIKLTSHEATIDELE